MTAFGSPDTGIHGMLDLETAGTGPNAAILTIGFLAFDPYTTEDFFKAHIVVPFEYNKDANISLETISWWMQQERSAQEAAWINNRNAADGDHRFFMDDIANLVSWFQRVETIWANDPDFDCVILRSFLERIPIQWKWYRKHRSMRTLKELFNIPSDIPPMGTTHNALDDCLYQAEQVRSVYQARAQIAYTRMRELPDPSL